MENSIVSTIEKIKLQEHDNEAKLKEKRTIDATLATVSRCLRDTISRAEKLKQEIVDVTTRADALYVELSIETMRHSALVEQLEASNKQLQTLKADSDKGISEVWKLRNLLSEKVQNTSDLCDVWALFTKPKYIESTIPSKKSQIDTIRIETSQEEISLQCVLNKRESLLEERNRLLNEPDSGDDFIRIKNALRYSKEMANQLMMKLENRY